MKKTLIASAISLLVLGGTNAKADIMLTSIGLGGTLTAATGVLLDAGGGTASGSDFIAEGVTWTLTQETLFMDNTGSWNGTSNEGLFNYDNEIATMTANQVAVGLFFNWSNPAGSSIANETAILEIFDCESVLGICTGLGVSLANGPFGDSDPDGSPNGLGFIYTFSGTGSATVVPVPAAAWLMGSGLFGLVAFARRKHPLMR